MVVEQLGMVEILTEIKCQQGVYLIFTSDDMGNEKISGKILIIK